MSAHEVYNVDMEFIIHYVGWDTLYAKHSKQILLTEYDWDFEASHSIWNPLEDWLVAIHKEYISELLNLPAPRLPP